MFKFFMIICVYIYIHKYIHIPYNVYNIHICPMCIYMGYICVCVYTPNKLSLH